MNEIDTHNEEVLQSKREDFDMFLAKEDWVNAQAVIDSIRECGNPHSADILRKAFLKAQYETVKDEITFVPFTHEEPPVLEACWFEGTPKQYEEAEFAGMNQHEAQYQAQKAQV